MSASSSSAGHSAPVPAQGTADGPDILCPMCDYNLRGISEPRCPECGFRFSWDELLDITRRQHPYLYEHRPLDAFKAFWRTLAGGLNPWKFWKTLHPAQPSDPRRLRRYFLWCMLPLAIALVAMLIAQNLIYYQSIQRNGGSITWLLSWRQLYRPTGFALRQTLFWLLLPVLQFAVLMLFCQSMHRARVKVIHVWRCVVYSWDPVLIVGALLCILAALFYAGSLASPGRLLLAGGGFMPRYPSSFFAIVHWTMVALMLLTGVKLSAAYRLYLRFHWPELTVVAMQVILLLVIAILVTNGIL